jgi:hypothetical protein
VALIVALIKANPKDRAPLPYTKIQPAEINGDRARLTAIAVEGRRMYEHVVNFQKTEAGWRIQK